MIQPAFIMEQYEQGRVPEHWRVIQGQGRPFASFLAVMCVCTFFFGIVCAALLTLIDATVSQKQFAGPFLFQAIKDPTLFNTLTFYPYVILPVGLALLIALLAARSSAIRKDSLLFLLPEGVLQCVHASKSAKRVYTQLDFLEIEDITIRTNYSDRVRNTHVTARSVAHWLDVFYKAQYEARWPLDQRFGDPHITGQLILKAFSRYVGRSREQGYL